MLSSPDFYRVGPIKVVHDELSESNVTEEQIENRTNVENGFQPVEHYAPYINSLSVTNEMDLEARDSNENPIRSKPRPFNPDLDIKMSIDEVDKLFRQQLPGVTNSSSRNSSNTTERPAGLLEPKISISVPPVVTVPSDSNAHRRLWQESDFQLAVISPTSSSDSSILELEDRKCGNSATAVNESENINSILQRSGLPVLDFSQLRDDNKDEFYQRYIHIMADNYERRETLLKKLAKQSLYTPEDKPSHDIITEVSERVDAILYDCRMTKRSNLADNVRSIGRRLVKCEKQSIVANTLMDMIENEEMEAPELKVLFTDDSDFDKRIGSTVSKLQSMKKYKPKYKSLLYLKYKVVDMINRMTDQSLDQLIDVEKLLPLVDKNKFSVKRVREILLSRAFTPEWKIRELREIFGV